MAAKGDGEESRRSAEAEGRLVDRGATKMAEIVEPKSIR
jgi:hypothetical protein